MSVFRQWYFVACFFIAATVSGVVRAEVDSFVHERLDLVLDHPAFETGRLDFAQIPGFRIEEWSTGVSFNVLATGVFEIVDLGFGDPGVQLAGSYTLKYVIDGAVQQYKFDFIEDYDWCCSNGAVGPTPFSKFFHVDMTNYLLIEGLNTALVSIDFDLELVKYATVVSDENIEISDAKFTSYFVGYGPSVPEPETWVMMILGVGAIGGVLRMRRGLPAVMIADDTSQKSEASSVERAGVAFRPSGRFAVPSGCA